METAYVTSSNIEQIGHENDTLYIRFRSGGVYSYSDCAYTFFDALKKAESAGQFFHRWIKKKFRYMKLSTDPFVKR